MPHIDPLVGLFAPSPGCWRRSSLPCSCRSARVSPKVCGEVAGDAERPTRIEAGLEAVQSEHGALPATNERLARVEGTVAAAGG